MARQPEAVLVAKIRTAIRREYPEAWTLKVSGGPTQEAGVPDLLVCVRGRLIGLEVKCPAPGETDEHARGRATLLQLSQIARLRLAGAVAEVVIDPAEALAAIRKSLRQ